MVCFESSQSVALFVEGTLLQSLNLFSGVDAELPCNRTTQPLLPQLIKSVSQRGPANTLYRSGGRPPLLVSL